MSGIFLASSLPAGNIPPLFPFQDIVFHLIAYLLLVLFFTRALDNLKPDLLTVQLFLCAAVFGTLYGISDELHQSFVPGRSVSGFDVFIDFLGSAIGSKAYLWLR